MQLLCHRRCFELRIDCADVRYAAMHEPPRLPLSLERIRRAAASGSGFVPTVFSNASRNPAGEASRLHMMAFARHRAMGHRTWIVTGLLFFVSVFGIRTFNTPSLHSASILLVSTSSGSAKLRANVP